METQPPSDPTDASQETGFRLNRLEVLNWGTFHEAVHVLRLEGKTSLLTGPNGSGKSTLVDALLTLLVPRNAGRNYNMASGAAKKTERSERTYIQGVWAEGLVGDSEVIESKKLRPQPGTPSILLGVFHNAFTAEWVTIGQVLWMAGEQEDHIFIVTSDERSIVRDFKDLGDPKKIERTLQGRGMDVFPRFSGYAETFCKRMHLKYPDALNLFNTVVAIKETGEIADFIRRHMLVRFEKADMLIQDADQHLEDLETCKRDIETARQQIELLRPVGERHQALEVARAALKEVQYARDGLRGYFAQVLTKQGNARLVEIHEDFEKSEAKAESIRLMKSQAEERRDQAISALAGSPEAGQLDALDAQEREANAAAQQKNTARFKYDGLLKIVGLRDPVANEAQFRAMRSRIESKRATAKGAFEEAIRKQAEFSTQAGQKREEARSKRGQIAQLQNSRSRFRGEQPAIRDALCRATGIPVASLPFAGELIEVKKDRADWRESLELLLGGFGRSMLVEDRHFRDVVRYLHKNKINGKLDFNRIGSAAPALGEQKAGDMNRVFSLLNLRPDHPMRGSVAEEIRRRFPHVCCADEAEFNANEYAVTKTNLNRSGARGTKDDRRRTVDPENFVLGWDNQDLVGTLLQRAQALETEADKLEQLAARMGQNKTETDTQLDAYSSLLQTERFDQISVEAELRAVAAIKATRLQLLSKDSKLGRLTSAKEKAVGEVAGTVEELQRVAIEQAGLEREKRAVQLIIERRAQALSELPPNTVLADLGEKLRRYLGKKSITLSDADATENDALVAVGADLNRKSKAVSETGEQLRDAMTAFLIKFPNLHTDLSAKEEKVGDFLGLMQLLDKEKLPEAEARFIKLMNDNIQKNIALLDQKLRESVEEYKQVLKGLSASLREIEYNRGTFIRINGTITRAAQVLQFQRDLKECLIGAVSPSKETMEAAFDRIRTLFGRLRSDEKWRRFVTDTRNWLDFRVDEVTYEQPERVSPHSSTDSKSGGQKAKLAFTVMAAAVAYQYGLLREQADARSFRFVVIDEIFGKTDETNSIYALKLFRKFRLQLLVVCPFSAQARVVDDFVSSYHLTSNPEWNNSQLISATLEQISEARRDQLAGSS